MTVGKGHDPCEFVGGVTGAHVARLRDLSPTIEAVDYTSVLERVNYPALTDGACTVRCNSIVARVKGEFN